MQVSIIIPTYNRIKEVNETLNSIFIQTILPREIIIVDDSDNDKIENLIEYKKKEFEEKEIILRYIRNKKEKSAGIARNIGVENAVGDIILFLDDDVELDKDYIKEILKVYEKYPNALGVQGYITNIKFSKFWNRINKILFFGYLEKNKCKVLPSTYTIYPYPLDKVISCEYLSSSNLSFKREVLQNFKYDENLKRYSYKEDVDISYNVFKKYPNSLYITPYARLIHKVSEKARLPNKMVIQIKCIYTLYIFYKDIDQTMKSKLIFLWNRIGYLTMSLLISIGSFIKRRSSIGLIEVRYIVGGYIKCLRNLQKIKKGDLEFFNKEISQRTFF